MLSFIQKIKDWFFGRTYNDLRTRAEGLAKDIQAHIDLQNAKIEKMLDVRDQVDVEIGLALDETTKTEKLRNGLDNALHM